MDKKDLRIGDYVRWKNEFLHVEELRKNKCVIANEDNSSEFEVDYDSIEPIMLTPTLLKMNGLRVDHCDHQEVFSLLHDRIHGYYVDSVPQISRKVVFNYGIDSFDVEHRMHYFHELQHIFDEFDYFKIRRFKPFYVYD